jgi:hypothetical protein
MNKYSYTVYLIEYNFWRYISSSVYNDTCDIIYMSMRSHVVDSVSISVRVPVVNYVCQIITEMNDYE